MKEMLLDTLTRYRQMQVQADSKTFATKDELRGYINRIEQTEDGIIFFDGSGKQVLKIPAMIKNQNLNGGD